MSIKRFSLGTRYSGNMGVPDMVGKKDGDYVLYTDYAALVALTEALKLGGVTVDRVAAPVAQEPVANCWSNNDGDSWGEHPADIDFVDGLKVGDEYALQASVSSWTERFRVIKAPDDTSDDYEVEPVSSIRTAPRPPTSAQPSVPDGWAVKRVGEAIHIERSDGKWCGYMLAARGGPAYDLTYEFLNALLAAPIPAADGRQQRAEFEAYINPIGSSDEWITQDRGKYKFRFVQTAWEVWLAHAYTSPTRNQKTKRQPREIGVSY